MCCCGGWWPVIRALFLVADMGSDCLNVWDYHNKAYEKNNNETNFLSSRFYEHLNKNSTGTETVLESYYFIISFSAMLLPMAIATICLLIYLLYCYFMDIRQFFISFCCNPKCGKVFGTITSSLILPLTFIFASITSILVIFLSWIVSPLLHILFAFFIAFGNKPAGKDESIMKNLAWKKFAILMMFLSIVETVFEAVPQAILGLSLSFHQLKHSSLMDNESRLMHLWETYPYQVVSLFFSLCSVVMTLGTVAYQTTNDWDNSIFGMVTFLKDRYKETHQKAKAKKDFRQEKEEEIKMLNDQIKHLNEDKQILTHQKTWEKEDEIKTLNDQIKHLNEEKQKFLKKEKHQKAKAEKDFKREKEEEENHKNTGFVSTLKNVFIYLWEVKLLILVPWDIYSDIKLAITHFGDGNIGWGSLTVSCLLPSLMFPYHYYKLLKFAMYKFKILFDYSEDSIEAYKEEAKKLEKKNRFGQGIIAYFEDIPQFVLQVYILWKTPVSCFSWLQFDAVQSIGTSFLSISATVVPFYEKENDEDWDLFSLKGFVTFLIGTFFNVIPKLVLISWTFSVLNWYGWFYISPLMLVCAIMAFCWKHDIKCIPNFIKNMKKENIDNDRKDDKTKKTNEKIFFYVLLRSLQLAFGYAGLLANFIVAILLLLFLIPLGLNLAAVIDSPMETNEDPFHVFPMDPFPSSTLCFTNTTILDQQERWENNTTPFSNSCNKTFEAIPCQDVKLTIITKLSIMIGIMSAGHFVTVSVGLLGFFIFAFLWRSSDSEEEVEDEERLKLITAEHSWPSQTQSPREEEHRKFWEKQSNKKKRFLYFKSKTASQLDHSDFELQNKSYQKVQNTDAKINKETTSDTPPPSCPSTPTLPQHDSQISCKSTQEIHWKKKILNRRQYCSIYLGESKISSSSSSNSLSIMPLPISEEFQDDENTQLLDDDDLQKSINVEEPKKKNSFLCTASQLDHSDLELQNINNEEDVENTQLLNGDIKKNNRSPFLKSKTASQLDNSENQNDEEVQNTDAKNYGETSGTPPPSCPSTPTLLPENDSQSSDTESTQEYKKEEQKEDNS